VAIGAALPLFLTDSPSAFFQTRSEVCVWPPAFPFHFHFHAEKDPCQDSVPIGADN
jgi:hypothetical protein